MAKHSRTPMLHSVVFLSNRVGLVTLTPSPWHRRPRDTRKREEPWGKARLSKDRWFVRAGWSESFTSGSVRGWGWNSPALLDPQHPQFMPTPPKNGTDAKENFDWQLMYYTHVFLANRGLLITPFHNMMLIPSVATDEGIGRLIQGWEDCMAEIVEISEEKK